MPVDLLLVRHGESEGNVAVHASKRGDDTHILNPEFRERHSSMWRLTEQGVAQAQQAGAWIRENFPVSASNDLDGADADEGFGDAVPAGSFDRYYVSAYTRALETAAHLNLPQARWFISPNLRERERGTEDLLSREERELLVESARVRKATPLYWRPLNGESIADTCTRVRDLFATLHREVPEGRVIVVCHGEVMEAARVLLERLTPDEYAAWTDSKDPADRIHNGQVFHYTRRDPVTGAISKHLNWKRSICTSDLSLCDPSWRTVTRPVFDNQALLDIVQRTPRIIS